MGILKRTVRGIRDSIPAGYIIGRVSSGEGPAQLIDLKTLTIAQQAVMPAGQLSPTLGTNADFGFFFQGKPGLSNMLLAAIPLTKAIKLPASLGGSEFNAATPPIADYTVSLLKNGTPIGSITFAAGTGAPSSVFTLTVQFNIGDIFKIVGPVAADAAIQNISFAFSAVFAA